MHSLSGIKRNIDTQQKFQNMVRHTFCAFNTYQKYLQWYQAMQRGGEGGGWGGGAIVCFPCDSGAGAIFSLFNKYKLCRLTKGGGHSPVASISRFTLVHISICRERVPHQNELSVKRTQGCGIKLKITFYSNSKCDCASPVARIL